ncbi:H-NS histone family protein [Mesorhizobium sp. CN2-181]|uniref:H-NS histone family protein n=1 Tax=Mesorhizobium yinganensis TaxID=3157707 RepID=UPI0032B71254
MSNMSMSAAPVAGTRRMVFDQKSYDEIPNFLRKEIGMPPVKEEILEPTRPASIQDPETNDVEDALPAETASEIQEPTQDAAEQLTMDPGTDGTTPNLDDMSVQDLQKLQEEIDRKKAEKQQAEKAAVIKQIVEVVNMYKIPVDELVEALGGLKVKRKGVKAQPKYKGPKGEIWSGRGKEPLWIKGKDRDKFLIRA